MREREKEFEEKGVCMYCQEEVSQGMKEGRKDKIAVLRERKRELSERKRRPLTGLSHLHLNSLIKPINKKYYSINYKTNKMSCFF
ncbi:hypothetical protein Hanom_Chr02g00153771 [Helianthus anomalus]